MRHGQSTPRLELQRQFFALKALFIITYAGVIAVVYLVLIDGLENAKIRGTLGEQKIHMRILSRSQTNKL